MNLRAEADTKDDRDAEITDLDLAWERINALGGYCADDFDRGINFAICEALKIIEDLGGADPLPKRAEYRQANSQFGVGA